MDPATLNKMADKGREAASTLCRNGWVTLERRRYRTPGQSVRPADDWLDAARGAVSLATRQLCCQLNRGSRSFEMTSQNLKQAAGLDLSRDAVRRVVEAEGKAVLELSRQGELAPTWNAKQCVGEDGRSRVYLSSDGFMAPMVTDVEKRNRRRKAKEKRRGRQGEKRPFPPIKRGADQRYKEFKAVMFYDQEMERRQVSATSGNCDSAGRLMSRDAWRLGFGAADERVGNIDGGPWIMNQIQKRKLKMTAVGLDFYHLSENIHKMRRIVFGEGDPRGDQMAADLLHTVRHEGYEAMFEKLLELRRQIRGKPKRHEMDRLIEYVSSRREMIQYPRFEARGWQIGSGPMESECRVIPDRVKGPGKRWDVDNAEAIMALEAMCQSNQCEEYWKLALARLN